MGDIGKEASRSKREGEVKEGLVLHATSSAFLHSQTSM